MKSKLRKEIDKLFPENMSFYNTWGKRKKHKLKTFTVNLTENMHCAIEVLVESGRFINKTEFVRFVITDFINRIE